MITTEGILAKAVSTLVGRLGGVFANQSAARRKSACRYLVKLYYAIRSLHEVTGRVIAEVDTHENSRPASSLFAALVREQDAIEYSTNAFVDLAADLQRGLALLNPALHQLCRDIYKGKADFLSCMSFGLRPDFSGVTGRVVLCVPTDELLATDFDAAYIKSREVVTAGQDFYWPSGAFDYFRTTEELEISVESDAAAAKVNSLLRAHHSSLAAALEQLRVMLAQSFTVDELLFHADETPR